MNSKKNNIPLLKQYPKFLFNNALRHHLDGFVHASTMYGTGEVPLMQVIRDWIELNGLDEGLDVVAKSEQVSFYRVRKEFREYVKQMRVSPKLKNHMYEFIEEMMEERVLEKL